MLFRWSYTLEHVPFNWRQVRVIFIHKTSRRDLEQFKAFRSISLMSVLLKSMERLVAAHICSTALVDHPIQGGVLSAFLWSLVIDSLLVELDSKGFEVVGYADDIGTLVRGKFACHI